MPSQPRLAAELRRRLEPVERLAPLSLGGRQLPSGSLVAVAMSGGVDSSMAAALSVASGLDTIGFTMRLWGSQEMERGEGGCCSLDAVEDARRVCALLGIPHYVLNLADRFRETVVDDFFGKYAAGLTPNPCIRCNEKIKFSEWVRRVEGIGASHIATGHYARVEEQQEGCTLQRAADLGKDQSYTLYRCEPSVLENLVLPLGPLQKSQVRRMAETLGLQVAHKPDSQELCFVGGQDHRILLRDGLAGQFASGPIQDLEGRVVGEHQGLPFYTVGQRQGLGLRVTSADSEARYVVELDGSRNTLVVGPWRALLRSDCRLERCVYLGNRPGRGALAGKAQLRAHGRPTEALWEPGEVEDAVVRFAVPQAAIAPGQSLVLYDGDRVVAGGEVAA